MRFEDPPHFIEEKIIPEKQLICSKPHRTKTLGLPAPKFKLTPPTEYYCLPLIHTTPYNTTLLFSISSGSVKKKFVERLLCARSVLGTTETVVLAEGHGHFVDFKLAQSGP